MLSGCLEMGCWMTEADAFYETQLFYLFFFFNIFWYFDLLVWLLRLPQALLSLHKERGYWDTKHLFKEESANTGDLCLHADPTSQTRERLMVTESLQACWGLTSSPRIQLLLEAGLELKCCLVSPLCGAAPSDGDHVASISSCTRASSAKGGDDGAWLCSPEQVKALGGTSVLHWQAGRFLALSMRLLPSEVYCVGGHLSRLFMSCYTHHSLLRLAHLHRVLRAIS